MDINEENERPYEGVVSIPPCSSSDFSSFVAAPSNDSKALNEILEPFFKEIAEKNVLQLAASKDAILAMAERVMGFDPYKVWTHIFQNQGLCDCICKIHKNSQKWSGIHLGPVQAEGFQSSVVQHFQQFYTQGAQNLKMAEFTQKFELGSPPSSLEEWQAFVDRLVERAKECCTSAV